MTAPPTPTDAAEALATVRASRRQLLDRSKANSSWTRHAAFAVLISGFIAAIAAPTLVNLLIDGVLALGLGLLIAAERTRHGVFVNGWRRGRTRPVVIGITLAYLALACASFWLMRDRGVWWAPLAGGAILFPIALFGSRLCQAAYRRELEHDV